jgi:hypothetical protein
MLKIVSPTKIATVSLLGAGATRRQQKERVPRDILDWGSLGPWQKEIGTLGTLLNWLSSLCTQVTLRCSCWEAEPRK